MNHKELGDLLIARLRTTALSDHLVAKFTQSADSTVDGWRRDRDPKPPRGERLNRLWHLLHFAGVDSPELLELPEFGRYLGELMAFGVLGMEHAQFVCGNVGEKAVLDTIRGTGQPARPRFTADQLKTKYDNLLQEKKEFWRSRVPLSEGIAPAVQPVISQAVPASLGSESSDFILDLATRLGALLPLLNHAVSDALSPKQRDTLRQLVGPDSIFRIAAALRALNSERVRASQLAQGR